jgi:hypothetical protein
MPDILTSDTWDDWLPDEVMSAADLPLVVERAERKLIARYRGPQRASPLTHGNHGSLYPVQLIDWEETDDGTPDTAAMSDRLVTRLRDTIARIVTHWETSVDEDIESVSQGSKSVSYSKGAGSLPMSVWEPLRPYDDRTPYSPGL